MREYELCTRILSSRLMPKDQGRLVESKLRKVHTADVVATAVDAWCVYRYDQEEDPGRFFPFFNNAKDDKAGQAAAPADLLKFCDYIILVEKSNRLYVLLIEMKSGGSGDADKQLRASEMFMRFVLDTAQRIGPANGYRELDIRNNVCFRKVILKREFKPGTNKRRSGNNQPDWKAETIRLSSQTVPLLRLCKRG